MNEHLSGHNVAQKLSELISESEGTSPEVCEGVTPRLVVCVHEELAVRQVKGPNGETNCTQLEHVDVDPCLRRTPRCMGDSVGI